jgi:hypothetical protein
MRPPNSIEKRDSIEFLQSSDVAAISDEALFNHVKTLFTDYSIVVAHTNPGLFLYRGIKYDDKPNNWDQLIYPPNRLAKTNRANSAGQPMFYCSTLKKSVFYELFARTTDRLVITTWILAKQALFANIGYTTTNLTRLGTTRQRPFNKKALDDLEQNDGDLMTTEFLGSVFCKTVLPGKESFYRLTSAISNMYINQQVIMGTDFYTPDNSVDIFPQHPRGHKDDQEFPGIQYPTIRNNGMEDNFAIKPAAIDSHLLELERVEYVEIGNMLGDKYQYKLLDIAFSLNGSKINWLNLNKTWCFSEDQDDIVFISEDNQVKAYTSDGDVIDPD